MTGFVKNVEDVGGFKLPSVEVAPEEMNGPQPRIPGGAFVACQIGRVKPAACDQAEWIVNI